MSDISQQEIKLFYCYAHKDKTLRDELEKYLSVLKRQYYLTNWHDRVILPGENWEQAIDKYLSTADLILLLISPDFMVSDYCYSKEMKRALERHHLGTCCVIPILLRPTYWEGTPFSNIQLLPTDAKPITRWPDRDEAFHDVVKGISATIKALLILRKTKENTRIPSTPQIFSTSYKHPDNPMTLEKFVNDDPGYLKWVKNNSRGFIINASKPEPSSYLMLHRATCGQISSETRTNYTTTDYFKICSLSKNELVDWARNQRGKLAACKICNP